MSCVLAGSVPLSEVPTSALLAPLSVHGVVLFALPGAVVHVDAAEYVAWLSERLAILSEREMRAALAAASASAPVPTPARASARSPEPALVPVPAVAPPPRHMSPRQMSTSPALSAALPPRSERSERSERTSTAGASPPTRRVPMLKRIFDRAPEVVAAAKLPRRSISMDVLRRRASLSTGSLSAGSSASSPPPQSPAPPAPGVLVYPRATRPGDAPRVTPRVPVPPLPPSPVPAESDGSCDSPQSMSAQDLAMGGRRRSLSDAGATPPVFTFRDGPAKAPPAKPVRPAARRADSRIPLAQPAPRHPTLAFACELPGPTSSASGSELGGDVPRDRSVARRSLGAARRSLSLGDGSLRKSADARPAYSAERAGATLARRASTVGFVPIGSAGAFEAVPPTFEREEPAAGKLGRLNSRMRKSLRRGKRSESKFRLSLAADDGSSSAFAGLAGPTLARTQSTGAISPNADRVSMSARVPFRSLSRHNPDDPHASSRVKRIAARFRLKTPKAPYQPV